MCYFILPVERCSSFFLECFLLLLRVLSSTICYYFIDNLSFLFGCISFSLVFCSFDVSKCEFGFVSFSLNCFYTYWLMIFVSFMEYISLLAILSLKFASPWLCQLFTILSLAQFTLCVLEFLIFFTKLFSL